MKTTIAIFSLLIVFISLNTSAQDKKRLKIIEKSIKNNSFEFYKDTVYSAGMASYVLKTPKDKKLMLSDKLKYKELTDLTGKMICRINFYYEQMVPFQISKYFAFWLSFDGYEGDARFILKEPVKSDLQELGLIKYLTENNIISSKGVNGSNVASFIKEHKETRFECGITNECVSTDLKIVVKNKNGEMTDTSFPERRMFPIAFAIGDQIELYIANQLYSTKKIDSKFDVITVSPSCNGFSTR